MKNLILPYFPKISMQGYRPYAAIFLLALVVRLVYLWEIKAEPFTTLFLLGDAESYDAWAQEIVQKGWVGSNTFYQAPFYPYFLALIYTIGARDFIVVRLVQVVIGAFSCILLARAGTCFFDKKTGWLSGILLSLYAGALFFDLLVQKAVLGMFFMSSLLYLMGRTAQRADENRIQTGCWILMGVVLACFGLTRENALVLIPAVVVWLTLFFHRCGFRQNVRRGLFLFIGLANIFLPVTLRNYVVGGEWVLTTSQMGPNFYIGNSKDATGFYRPLVWDQSDWKFERNDARNLAKKALGRDLTPNEVSNYWLFETISHIRQDPGRWLGLMAKKWLLTWNAVEISDSESQYTHYRYSHLLNGLGTFFHFGIFCPLAILGLYLTWHQRRKLWGLYWIWLCFAASVVLFFVFSRYRHPMISLTLLFAAAGITHGYRCLKENRRGRLAAGILVTLPFAVVINWPLVSKAKMEAPTFFNIGYELEQRSDLDQARAYYIRSLNLDDTNPLVHNNLGVVAMKRNQRQEALMYFRAAVALKADYWTARVNLGIVLWQMGRAADAVEQYEKVLSAKPDENPALYYNIACFHALKGRPEQGLAWLRKALTHGYDRWDLIKEDPDIETIRNLPEYQDILKAHSGTTQNR